MRTLQIQYTTHWSSNSVQLISHHLHRPPWEISNPNTNRGWNLSHFVIVFLWMGLNLQTFFEMGSKTQESHEVLKRSLPHSLLEVCLFQIEFMLQSTNAIKKLEAIAL